MLTVKEVAQLEDLCEKHHISRLQLMETAGFEIAKELTLTYKNPHYFFLCGQGSNGGDGFCAARLLKHHPTLVAFIGKEQKLPVEAAVQFQKARVSKIPMLTTREEIINALKKTKDSTIIVDAVVGTGLKGMPRPLFAEIITAANKAKGHKVSIDVPSGIDPDTGKDQGIYFKPEKIITLHDMKPGLQRFRAMTTIRPIGIPPAAIQEFKMRKARTA